jgi:hypothetical protein
MPVAITSDMDGIQGRETRLQRPSRPSSYKLPLTVMCGCELRKKVSIAGANPISTTRLGAVTERRITLMVHP